MSALHEKFGLTRVINAAGTYTPLGVSRSPQAVRQAAAQALGEFFVMDELQDALSARVARLTGAEAAVATHCVSAGITLSVAAAIAGSAPERIAALPDTNGLPGRIVLPAGHAVNYGHPIEQDVRLAGGVPVLAGSEAGCTEAELDEALGRAGTGALLLVSSRLVRGALVDLARAVALAHRHNLPAILDGAAQDLRIDELLATGADLVLVSPHKYMASPTVGLVLGRRALVAAVRAHEKGIGRAMKPTKEAIVGLLAALEEREALDLSAWRREQDAKVAALVSRAGALRGLRAEAIADPAGMPFRRARLHVDPQSAGLDARSLAHALRGGDPSIRVMEHAVSEGVLDLELVPLTAEEIDAIASRIETLTGTA